MAAGKVVNVSDSASGEMGENEPSNLALIGPNPISCETWKALLSFISNLDDYLLVLCCLRCVENTTELTECVWIKSIQNKPCLK